MDFASPVPDSGSLHSSSERTMPTRYVARIEVTYIADGPGEVVTEINGKGDNINQGFEAESAWLVCHYTSAPSAACITFEVWIQNKVINDHCDLSKGVGRERRYVVPVVSPSSNDKVAEVRLLRPQSPIVQPPEGYSQISRNINDGRGGDYLYLVWKTVPFDPAPVLNGVYVIRNKSTDTVLDLSGGSSSNKTKIQGCGAVHMERYYFNQNWLIEKIGESNRYSVRNIRTNTCMEVAYGSSEDSAKVQGYQMNGGAAQEWNIMGTGETGYSFFNVAAGTVLDISSSVGGTPVITYHSHGGDSQLWFLERRSFNTGDVSRILTNCQYSSDQFKRCGEDRACIICPEQAILGIWDEYKLNSLRDRKDYGADDLAFAMKAAVTDWAYKYVQTPVRLFFGIVVCIDDKKKNTYNWSLDQNLSAITFFEPQSGRMVMIPKYATYSGMY